MATLGYATWTGTGPGTITLPELRALPQSTVDELEVFMNAGGLLNSPGAETIIKRGQLRNHLVLAAIVVGVYLILK
jgi:hypothetical protein